MDGGSPLSCVHPSGHHFLAGIVSWGSGCGQGSAPRCKSLLTAVYILPPQPFHPTNQVRELDSKKLQSDTAGGNILKEVCNSLICVIVAVFCDATCVFYIGHVNKQNCQQKFWLKAVSMKDLTSELARFVYTAGIGSSQPKPYPTRPTA